MIRVRNVRAERFMKYRRMAFGIAKEFSKKFRKPYLALADEAQSHLAHMICERWDDYDPEKGQPTTWLHHGIYWHLMRVCYVPEKGKKTFSLESVAVTRRDCGDTTDTLWRDLLPAKEPSWMDSLLAEVGNEGRALLRVLLGAQGEVTENLVTIQELLKRKPEVQRKEFRRTIRRHLRTEEGWEKNRIRQAFKELEECLS